MEVLIKSKQNLWTILLIVHEHFQTFSSAHPSSPGNTIDVLLVCLQFNY